MFERLLSKLFPVRRTIYEQLLRGKNTVANTHCRILSEEEVLELKYREDAERVNDALPALRK